MKNKAQVSYYIAWLCCSIIVGHSLFYHLTNPDGLNVISWDVYGYYVYLPAVFNYGDPFTYNFLSEHFTNYSISSNLYQVGTFEDGKMAPIYTIGLAIIWTPGYAIANLIAWIFNYPLDGLSLPYQWSVIITNWLFTILGIYFLRKTLLKICKDYITALVLVFIFLGTNYYHYAVFENGMSHTYLLSLYSILLYYTITWHQKPNTLHTIFIGVSIALLCLARPTEIISLLIPLLYGVYSFETLSEKATLIIQQWRKVILLAITGVILVSTQLIYWKAPMGVWFNNGYAGHHFDWWDPHIWEGIFSYRKGWLIYTPIMLFAILGLIPLFYLQRKWRYSVLIFLSINIYIVLSWHIWWYASSFGMRALIQSYAILAIPMGVFLEKATQSLFSRVGIISIGIFMIGLNHFQDWQYRNRILAMDEMTKTFYWNAWGKTTFDGDAYKYLDINECLPKTLKGNTETLAQYLAGQDSTKLLQELTYKNKVAFFQPAGKEFGPGCTYNIPESRVDELQGKWLLIKGNLLSSGAKFDKYYAARLVCSIEREGKAVKWVGVRFQQYRPDEEWVNLEYHVQLPDELNANDQIKIYLWNQSPDTIYIHQLSLDLVVN